MDPTPKYTIGLAHGKFNTKSISNCNFSLALKRKMYKTSMKNLRIHKLPFKNVIFLAIECKMHLKIQQKLRCLSCISKQTMRSAIKKTRLNSSMDDFLMKSFPSSTKKKNWAFFWTFSFYFLSLNGVFLTLKCRTLGLTPPHGDCVAAILLKMEIFHWGFQIW